jgi:hypothetical protein
MRGFFAAYDESPESTMRENGILFHEGVRHQASGDKCQASGVKRQVARGGTAYLRSGSVPVRTLRAGGVDIRFVTRRKGASQLELRRYGEPQLRDAVNREEKIRRSEGGCLTSSRTARRLGRPNGFVSNAPNVPLPSHAGFVGLLDGLAAAIDSRRGWQAESVILSAPSTAASSTSATRPA